LITFKIFIDTSNHQLFIKIKETQNDTSNHQI